jgi:hypothetical protein
MSKHPLILIWTLKRKESLRPVDLYLKACQTLVSTEGYPSAPPTKHKQLAKCAVSSLHPFIWPSWMLRCPYLHSTVHIINDVQHKSGSWLVTSMLQWKQTPCLAGHRILNPTTTMHFHMTFCLQLRHVGSIQVARSFLGFSSNLDQLRKVKIVARNFSQDTKLVRLNQVYHPFGPVRTQNPKYRHVTSKIFSTD